MIKFSENGFNFVVDERSCQVLSYDLAGRNDWSEGSLERMGLRVAENTCGEESYSTMDDLRLAVSKVTDYVKWFACKEVERGYVWLESEVGMWGDSTRYGCRAQGRPTSKAMPMPWEDAQKFSVRFAMMIGGPGDIEQSSFWQGGNE